MLILSRKKGEKIRLGDKGEITIQIVDVRGETIKVGILAPGEIPVHREEIFERMQKEYNSGHPR